jgi:hypothetical protein
MKDSRLEVYFKATENLDMTFGQALELLKLGRKVKRAKWDNLFVGCVILDIGSFLYINTEETTILYIPTNEDLLANDWLEII